MFVKDCCNNCTNDDGFNTYVNPGEPDQGVGENGDYYINCDTGDAYQKINDIWTFVCQIGEQSDDNCKSYYANGTPAVGLGNNCDTYINLGNGQIFEKTGGVWVSVGFLPCTCPEIFGQFYQYAENTTPLGTVSAAFALYLNLTTPVLPAGDYRIGLVFNYEATAASTVGEYQIQVDDAGVIPTLDTETLNLASAGERKSFSNFFSETLTAGVHSIDVDIRRSAGAGTFTIDDAKLEIWRVA